MSADHGRIVRGAVGAAIAALGFGGAVILGSTPLALVGSLGLIVALLALQRYPRSRD
jgi:hypothetical protein